MADYDGMAEGRHGKPRRFGGGTDPDLDGYSDHFPVAVKVREHAAM